MAEDIILEEDDLVAADATEDTMEPLQPKRRQRTAKGRSVKVQHISQFSRLHKKLGSSPLIMFFLGALVLLLWLCGTITQIQTSEFLAMGSTQRVATVAWSVLLQPWLMVTGQAPIQFATAWLYAWVVEVVTLVFALALSVAIVKINSVNHRFGKWFVVLGFVLIALNGYADYSSSPGTNPLVQFLIALAVGMIVTIGLPLGIGLIEHGVEEL